MKFSSTEADPQAELARLSHLQTALWCLIWTWVSVPGFIIMSASGPGGEIIGFVFIYLLFFTLLSGILLAKSAETAGEALKIVGIPSLFIAAIFVSAITELREFGQFGISGIYLAPIWLVEILRFRAAKYGFQRFSLLLLVQHFFSLLLLYLCYNASDGDLIGLIMIWYALHIAYFAGFLHLLKEPASSLQARVAALSS